MAPFKINRLSPIQILGHVEAPVFLGESEVKGCSQ